MASWIRTFFMRYGMVDTSEDKCGGISKVANPVQAMVQRWSTFLVYAIGKQRNTCHSNGPVGTLDVCCQEQQGG